VNVASTVPVVVEGGGDQVVAHVGLHALGRFGGRLGLADELSSAVAAGGENRLLGHCVAADFARQDPPGFRPHLRVSLAFTMEDQLDATSSSSFGSGRPFHVPPSSFRSPRRFR
jgi:hypothetical protein